MLVGKRLTFEEELPQPFQAYAMRRHLTQDKKLETLGQARKRLIQNNVQTLSTKYPQVAITEIQRLLEDFENNVEMVSDILGQNNKVPQKVDLNDVDINNYKKQIQHELLNRLSTSSDINQAQSLISSCFDAFEQKISESVQNNITKLVTENRTLKKAFLKQNQRLEKLKEEGEMKTKQHESQIKEYQEELKKQTIINNQLTLQLIQAQQSSQSYNMNVNYDIY